MSLAIMISSILSVLE